MGEFFLFLGILFQCGLFPMGWSDCDSRPSQDVPVLEMPQEGEAP